MPAAMEAAGSDGKFDKDGDGKLNLKSAELPWHPAPSPVRGKSLKEDKKPDDKEEERSKGKKGEGKKGEDKKSYPSLISSDYHKSPVKGLFFCDFKKRNRILFTPMPNPCAANCHLPYVP